MVTVNALKLPLWQLRRPGLTVFRRVTMANTKSPAGRPPPGIAPHTTAGRTFIKGVFRRHVRNAGGRGASGANGHRLKAETEPFISRFRMAGPVAARNVLSVAACRRTRDHRKKRPAHRSCSAGRSSALLFSGPNGHGHLAAATAVQLLKVVTDRFPALPWPVPGRSARVKPVALRRVARRLAAATGGKGNRNASCLRKGDHFGRAGHASTSIWPAASLPKCQYGSTGGVIPGTGSRCSPHSRPAAGSCGSAGSSRKDPALLTAILRTQEYPSRPGRSEIFALMPIRRRAGAIRRRPSAKPLGERGQVSPSGRCGETCSNKPGQPSRENVHRGTTLSP